MVVILEIVRFLKKGKNNMIVSLLTGRKDSKGFPNKHFYKIEGHEVAYYPMRASRKCPSIDKMYISTDDEGLMQMAKENGIEVIERPVYLCSDTALSEDVFTHGYNIIQERNKGELIEIIVILMCNALTVTSSIIQEGINTLKTNPAYDSAVTVSKYNMWSPIRARKIDSNGLLQPLVPFDCFDNINELNCDRDSQGDIWFADMGASIVRSRCIENIRNGKLPQKWMGQRIFPLKQKLGLDLDYEWQTYQVEQWLKLYGENE